VIEVDLSRSSVRALNERLHRLTPHTNELYWRVLNPNGAHAIAVGITQPVHVEIKGHVGYYCAGMNTAATVVVNGHAGTGLAENIAGGLDGIARRLDPGRRLDINMYEPGAAPAGIPRLPLNLLDALRAFQASTTLREALGSGFVDAYAKLRMAHWTDYMLHLSEWEREHTLDV
jgi:hypothetical protein